VTKVRNVSDHVLDTTPDGKVIAPGDFADVDVEETHNKLLLEDGVLLLADEDKQSAPRKEVK